MTLSDITAETRAFLKWGGIILGALIILFFLMKAKEAIFPTPPPPPKVGFGKLPPIEFPKGPSKSLSYSIGTVTGTLPTFATSEKVFKMQEVKPDLLSLQRAKEKAKAIDFMENPTVVSENVYQWKDSKGQILTMNILDFSFNLTSNFLSNPIPNFKKGKGDAVNSAKDFLQRMDLFYKDIDETKTTTDLLSVENFKLVPTLSLSNAQIVRVNFFQKNINNLEVFYPSQISPMNFLIGNPLDLKVFEGNFFYQTPSDFSSTYPIKSADQAFEELKKGNGYIAVSLGTNVSIKKVKLGYFMEEKRREFLMPVIVFEGEGFQAFVSGVTDEWVNK